MGLGIFFGLSGDGGQEKRRLADWPKWPNSFSQVNQYPAKFEKAVDDRFWGRNIFISFRSNLLYQFFKSSPDRKFVLIGKEGFLFLNKVPNQNMNAINAYRGSSPMPPDIIQRWRNRIGERQTQFSKMIGKKVKYYWIEYPNKASVYPQLLPSWIDKVGPSHYDQIRDEIMLPLKNKVKFIDTRAFLITQAVENQIYDKTDSHFNNLGAFLTSQFVLRHVFADFPNQKFSPSQIQTNTLKWTEESGGDLASIIGMKHSLYELRPNMTVIPTFKFYRLTSSELPEDTVWQGLYAFHSKNPNKLKALMIFDSFGAKQFKYYAPHFSQFYAIFWGEANKKNLKKIFETFKPDVVIDQRVVRNDQIPFDLK
jgi:alginate O-acetyltransferase complex protein AlgJ